MPTFYFSLAGRMAIADVHDENLPTLVDAMQEAEVFRMPLMGVH